MKFIVDVADISAFSHNYDPAAGIVWGESFPVGAGSSSISINENLPEFEGVSRTRIWGIAQLVGSVSLTNARIRTGSVSQGVLQATVEWDGSAPVGASVQVRAVCFGPCI